MNIACKIVFILVLFKFDLDKIFHVSLLINYSIFFSALYIDFWLLFKIERRKVTIMINRLFYLLIILSYVIITFHALLGSIGFLFIIYFILIMLN